MLKIGDFSKLSRVSIRMLRHYDGIGLLHPVKSDKFTGYRYYSEEQLVIAGMITALKNMGFGLSVIGDIMTHCDDAEKLRTYLSLRKKELEAEAEDTSQKLRLLDAAVKRLGKDNIMNYNVTLKTLPERYAACVRMTIPKYENEGMVWQVLCEETDCMNLVPSDPCYTSVVFYDGEYKEHDVDVEAQKTVKGNYPDTEHVKFRTLPPVTFASCTFKGSYELISEANAAVASWVEANGYEYAGPMFNIYHVSPHETSDPNEFVTEVCYPINKK